MMTAAAVADMLRERRTGTGRGVARCPRHDDSAESAHAFLNGNGGCNRQACGILMTPTPATVPKQIVKRSPVSAEGRQ